VSPDDLWSENQVNCMTLIIPPKHTFVDFILFAAGAVDVDITYLIVLILRCIYPEGVCIVRLGSVRAVMSDLSMYLSFND
jgi:hypothetical protein